MCDKAVDDFLPALKFVRDWFVTRKMTKNFIMFYSQMMIDLKSVNRRNRIKQRQAFKKDISKELMPVPWHPKRSWEWCMQDKKKGIKPIFTDKN